MFQRIRHLCMITNSNPSVVQGFQKFTDCSLWRHGVWHKSNFKRDKHAIMAESKEAQIMEHIKKIRDILKVTKDTNPATNAQLQRALGAAKKASVPQELVTSALQCGDVNTFSCIHSFIFQSLINQCMGVLEFKTEKVMIANQYSSAIIKKFGYKMRDRASDICVLYGMAISNPLNKSKDEFNEVLEHAVLCNFDEVVQLDNGKYKFECSPQNLAQYTGKLMDLGYPVEFVGLDYKFKNLVTATPEILNSHKKMEEKLKDLDGFIRVVYNIKGTS